MPWVNGVRLDRRGRNVCDCGGYKYPHRKFGGACYHSPRADYYHALRADVPVSEALQLLWADKLERMSTIPPTTDPRSLHANQ